MDDGYDVDDDDEGDVVDKVFIIIISDDCCCCCCWLSIPFESPLIEFDGYNLFWWLFKVVVVDVFENFPGTCDNSWSIVLPNAFNCWSISSNSLSVESTTTIKYGKKWLNYRL